MELLGSREESLYEQSLKKGRGLIMKHQLQEQCSRMVCRKAVVSKDATLRQSRTDWLQSKAAQVATQHQETQALIIELKDMVRVQGRRTFFRQLRESVDQLASDDKLCSTSFSLSHPHGHTEGVDFRTYSRPHNRSLYKIKATPLSPPAESVSPKCETSKTKEELIPWRDEVQRFKTEVDMSGEQMEEWMSLTFSDLQS